jgi:hypothetical protein
VNDYASTNQEHGSGESHSDSQMGDDYDEMADWVSNQRETIGFTNCQAYKTLAACKLCRGPAGRESAGIVDLMAIRKNHAKFDSRFKRGDLFEIILIQIKGGGARRPKREDIQRLRAVAKHYKARDVVLAEWIKESHLKFYKLGRNHRDLERAGKKSIQEFYFTRTKRQP